MTATRPAAAAALALLVLTGCQAGRDAEATGADGTAPLLTERSGPEPAPAQRAPRSAGPQEPRPSAGPAPEAPPEEAVEGYTEALAATGDPDRMREGLALTADPSAARDLLVHQALVAQAWADAGTPLGPGSSEPTGDGHRLCPPSGTGTACVRLTGFTGSDELVDGLLIDGTDPGPALVADSGRDDESEGVRASVLTAYQSVVGKDLVVTVGFAAGDDVSLDLAGASYRAEGGTETDAHRAVGRHELDAGETATAAFTFPGAVPGGELLVGGCLEECSALVLLELPVG